jgi:hypothetical protein
VDAQEVNHMRTMKRYIVAFLMIAVILQMAGCRQYVPPTTGLPSRQDWLEGGGG